MKKVMLVFGTRPEAIKMCPLVKEFQRREKEFETIVCVTGQRREKQGQDLYDVTARVLTGMRDVLKECRSDVVLAHGEATICIVDVLAA